jgi:Mce-associated membrane protein
MTESDLMELTEDQQALDVPDTAIPVEPVVAAAHTQRRHRWTRVLVYVLAPAIVIVLGGAAGYLKVVDGSGRASRLAAVQAVQAASEGTIAMVSYKPDTVEKDLGAARDRLTGSFRDSYTSLINDVVIPGAKQQQVTSVATVASASSVSATANHAVVLLFVNQAITMGSDPPSHTASSVRLTMDKTEDRWMITQFEPV